MVKRCGNFMIYTRFGEELCIIIGEGDKKDKVWER